ncbi:MAG: DUF512 domain-containing protein [Candidatus Cloacimonadota bacterium]|nr:DUF512 domain-containing protein [Candidatus Cloacimonadota bacterium]
MRIKNIISNSSASESSLKINDKIIKINNHRIRDFIDFQYSISEEFLDIEYTSNGEQKFTKIIREYQVPLGIELEEHKCRTCANNCVFCFVDQIKPGLRKGLNIKDDDYIFSFVFGNFITLTNMAQLDFERIANQHLSPLYVSVHTTNNNLHKRMMRYIHIFDILDRIDFLINNDIELHTQIVVVPGWNDGEELKKSLADLIKRRPKIISIGVVPVGLTKFRNNLLEIDKVDNIQANKIVTLCKQVSQDLEKNIIYCSDEIFLQAGKKIPNVKYYNDFPQIENGIGMIRNMLENWKTNKTKFIEEIKLLKQNLRFVCGTSVYNTIKEISDEINETLGYDKTNVKVIYNIFFGEEVTVSGLLTATDIFDQMSVDNDFLCVPASIFNHDDITLDDIHKNEFLSKTKGRLIIIQEDFSDWKIFN